MKNGITPDLYAPAKPSELIGEARKVAGALLALITKAKRTPSARLKLAIYGDIGAGKTSIALIAANELAGKIDIEKINGANVTLDLVRRWTDGAAYSSLFGAWKVKVINEVDKVPPAAQDLMLSYLDELPPQNAVIATSNLTLETLTERFQTRFRVVKVSGPRTAPLARWLISRWHLPKTAARFIALGSCGNVRAALNDAADYLTFGKLDARPKANGPQWRELRAADLRNRRRNGTHTA